MTSERPKGLHKNGKAKRTHVVKPQTQSNHGHTAIDVERSGDWMPVEDLREAALGALGAVGDLTLNLDRIDHLDASALQILLALDTEQKKRGQNLHLANASLHLRQWFDFAGVADHFSMTERKGNE